MPWCEHHMVFEGESGCNCDAEWEELQDDYRSEDDPGSDDGDPWGEDGRA